MVASKDRRAGGRRTSSNKKTKNRRPTSKKDNRPRYPKSEPKPRPVLANYEENRNAHTNQERLAAAIDCTHFGESCPGCVVNSKVGSVDIIQSANLYFSSTAVRKHRLDVDPRSSVVESSDDGFYQVVIPSSLKGWRTQAKLAVAPKGSKWQNDGCAFGLYKRGTHSVLSIPNCEVHHPSINRAVHALVAATEKVRTAAYEKEHDQGGLRYVQFQVERTTGRICLTLVWHGEGLKDTQPSLSRLIKELQRAEPDLWHSIWCHCNDTPLNNIFSRNPNRWHRLVGPEFMREPLAVGDKGWLYFTPLAFRQGNLDGFDVLATDVAKRIPEKSRVCELYAGVGVLGLTALAHHYDGGKPLTWVRCSDENPANPRCFHRSVSSLPFDMTGKNQPSSAKPKEESGMTLGELIAKMSTETADADVDTERQGEKTSYVVASAGRALQQGQALGANVIVVDPPRKGLEDDVLDELCKPFNPNQSYVENKDMLTIPDHQVNWCNDAETLIYVSCGFDALTRDCELILSSGAGWMLESATGYILFPGSNHVETLAVFQRRLG